MASPLGHSRAQLYKRCSARGWPNKILAQGSTSFCLSRPGKELNQVFETLCSAYTEFVLSFLFQSSHICHVFVQSTIILPIPRVKSEEKINSETVWARLTDPQINLLRVENRKNSTSTPRLMSHPIHSPPALISATQPDRAFKRHTHFRTLIDISILKSSHNNRLIWGFVSFGSVQIVTFGKQTLRSKQWCYVRIWEAAKQFTFSSLGRVTCCAWTLPLSCFSLFNQPGAPCEQGRGAGDTGSSRGTRGTKAKGLSSPHACGMNDPEKCTSWSVSSLLWNGIPAQKEKLLWFRVWSWCANDVPIALIMARAHHFFHGLIELQQRFDCFKRTEIGGNSAKSHSHLCVWEIQQNFSGLRPRDVKTKQHTEDFTQQWPDVQRSLHFIAVRHPAALVTLWKQPWNPEDAQACPKQLFVTSHPRSNHSHEQAKHRGQWRFMDCVVAHHLPQCTAYHACYSTTKE